MPISDQPSCRSELSDRAGGHVDDLARQPMRQLGELRVVAEQHHAVELVVERANDSQQVLGTARVQPIVHDDVLAFAAEFVGNELGRRQRAQRRTRQQQVRLDLPLGQALAHLGRLPLPRSANGRSRSAKVGSSLLDLACLTRNSVFIAGASDVHQFARARQFTTQRSTRCARAWRGGRVSVGLVALRAVALKGGYQCTCVASSCAP